MPGWPLSRLGLKPRQRLKAAEIALGEHEVILLHFVDQLAARLAEPQRRPAILRRLEAGADAAGRAVEVGRLRRVAENLIERGAAELVVRQSPGDFGGKAVGVQLVVGDVDLFDLAAFWEAARLAEPQQLAIPIGGAADQARLAAGLVESDPADAGFASSQSIE